MTVEFTIARIATIINNNPGGVGGAQAFTQIPREIQDNQLPAIVILPGPATYDTDSMGDEIVVEKRLYNVNFFYSRIDVGTEGQAQSECVPYFSRIRDFFNARPGLWDTGATQPEDVQFDSRLRGDQGFEKVQYGANTFYGIRFQLEVTEIAEIDYAD